MKEENRPTLTLTLPFIELPSGLKAFERSTYDEEGTFFVKDHDGVFHLVWVGSEDSGVWNCPLIPELGNLFTEQITEDRLAQELDSIKEVFDNEKNFLLDYIKETACGVVENIEQETNRLSCKIGDLNSELSQIKTFLDKEKQVQTSNSKGFITEEALIDIIKNVRK
jgi:hypothetical protein